MIGELAGDDDNKNNVIEIDVQHLKFQEYYSNLSQKKLSNGLLFYLKE